MFSRHPHIWKWLSFFAYGLMLLAVFAPLTPLADPLDRILSLGGSVFLLIYFSAVWREERREREADQPNGAAISPGDQT